MFAFGMPRMNNISAMDLQQGLASGEKPVIIDVREDWEFAEGRIPGSILRPLHQIRRWSQEFRKDQDIVLVCRTASRSAVAYQFLQSLGFTKLRNMSGGIVTWRGAVER